MMARIIAIATALSTTTVLGGCATLQDSLILGAGSGVAAGAATGLIVDSRHRGAGAAIGGAIGAVVGAGVAYFTHKGLEDRDAAVRKDALFNLERFGVSDVPTQSSSVPSISFRVVEEQKVETHRQGNKVVEGHRVWVIGDDSNVNATGTSNKK